METSYAAAAASAPSHTAMNGSSHFRKSVTSELCMPPPESWAFCAALQLHLPCKTAVYLVPLEYLQNWISWAYHQRYPPHEKERAKKALKLAAEMYSFSILEEYENPGAIDNRILSIPGHPLLLRPEVEIREPQSVIISSDGSQQALRRVVSFNGVSNGHGNPKSTEQGDEDDKVECCVVHEDFYEVRLVVSNHMYSLSWLLFFSFTDFVPLVDFASDAWSVCRRWL